MDGRSVGGRSVGGHGVDDRRVGGRGVGGRGVEGRGVGDRRVGGRGVDGRGVGGRSVGGRNISDEIVLVIIMEICKAPTLQLKALNKQTHIMYIEMENVIQKINMYISTSVQA